MSNGLRAFRKCLDTLEKGVLKAEKADEASKGGGEIDALKAQLTAMQERIEQLAKDR
jgi:hypothetical protein